jgi:hypothetical protein
MRTRFRKAEREAYEVGTAVEWRHGSRWYPGEVTKAPWRSDITGWDSVGVRNDGPTTRTISHGAYVTPSPTFVRLPGGEA